MRIRIQIQGFDDQQYKILQLEKLYIISSKLVIYFSRGFMKDVQATGEAFSLQKITSRT